MRFSVLVFPERLEFGKVVDGFALEKFKEALLFWLNELKELHRGMIRGVSNFVRIAASTARESVRRGGARLLCCYGLWLGDMRDSGCR
jgi:hypothetical protein